MFTQVSISFQCQWKVSVPTWLLWFAAGTLRPKIVNATEEHLKLKVANYAGATLLKINGKNPVAYIERYAEKGGVYKDLNARINR